MPRNRKTRNRKARNRETANRRLAALAAMVLAGAALTGALVAASAAASREILAGPVPARVVEIVDGDTIVVRARIWLGHEVETRVRLAGIDAPELKGKCARERSLALAARAFLAARLDGAWVTLRDVRYGKYAGRVLARLETAADGDIGAALLAAGLARPYEGRRRPSWCETAEGR